MAIKSYNSMELVVSKSWLPLFEIILLKLSTLQARGLFPRDSDLDFTTIQ